MRSVVLLLLSIPPTALFLASCGVKGDPIPYLEVVRRAEAERAKTDAEAAKAPTAGGKTAP